MANYDYHPPTFWFKGIAEESATVALTQQQFN